MKYLLFIFDGMADNIDDFAGGKTPIVMANTPNIDKIARKGVVGTAQTTPVGMNPGSDITNMGILGYDPNIFYKGRGAIEAAALGIEMSATDVAYRTNLISTDGKIMLDSSADHISDEEATELLKAINDNFSNDRISFHTGVSYRHIMVVKNGFMNVDLHPPYKFISESLENHKPQGDFSEEFWQMIQKSYEILENHPINIKRKKNGYLPANQIWFWAEGKVANFTDFKEKFNKKGSVIAAVDLIKGLGKLTGLSVPAIPEATGYIDTSYENKAKYAIKALKENDFVWIHIEAADEAGHEKNLTEKVKAIENMDNIVLKNILNYLEKNNEEYRILLMPDHPTPISTGSHTSDPVPFVIFDSRKDEKNYILYNEVSALKSSVKIDKAWELMPMLLEIEPKV